MEALPVLDFIVKSSIHNYEVKFIDNLDKIIKNEIRETDFIIIDSKVKSLYSDLFEKININLISLHAYEKNKSYEGIIPVIQQLINNGFRKNHRLVAVGGGIIQDITAFIASIMYRGVDWLFFPTTLLSQGDSCIGSKTSINFGEYKNQIGGFFPPKKIFINTEFLKTLSKNDLQSGLGEMSHYFVVAGKSEFKEYKNNYDNVDLNDELLQKMISNSLKIKKQYIEIDEFDQKERQVFNYGHSFGHAIESLTNYSIPHGIAVSFGMDIANFISVKKGLLNNSIRLEIKDLLQKIWSGYSISSLDVAKFSLALSKDKKNVGNELRLILCKGYGKVFKAPQKLDDEFKGWLKQYLTNESL